jgi:hypothetical protein
VFIGYENGAVGMFRLKLHTLPFRDDLNEETGSPKKNVKKNPEDQPMDI